MTVGTPSTKTEKPPSPQRGNNQDCGSGLREPLQDDKFVYVVCEQTTHNIQPTTYNLQPTTHNPQPTTYNLQHTTENKKQKTNNWQMTRVDRF